MAVDALDLATDQKAAGSVVALTRDPGSWSTSKAKPGRQRPTETATLVVMRPLMPDGPELRTLERRYVFGSYTGPIRLRYVKMGVNALRDGEPRRSLLMQSLAEDARQITDDELNILLSSEWRARLTAAWLVGLDRRIQFRDRLGTLLRDGALMKAGAGYAFALARFGQHPDAALLATALEHRLSRPETFYERQFVIGALLHLDERLGTDHARDILGGSWRQPVPSEPDRERFKGYMKQLCEFADECMFQEPSTSE